MYLSIGLQFVIQKVIVLFLWMTIIGVQYVVFILILRKLKTLEFLIQQRMRQKFVLILLLISIGTPMQLNQSYVFILNERVT